MRKSHTDPRGRRRGPGFSLPEALVTIAVIGIMCAVAIPVFGKLTEVSRSEVAENVAARINGALVTYRQTNSEPTTAADNSSTGDEAAIMTLLQTRDESVPGSPLLSGPGWPSAASSYQKIPRLRWNGRFFEVIQEGTNGTGLKIGN